MTELKVKDALSKKFYVVDVEDTLSYCLGIFRERHPQALVVQDGGKGKVVGMLSERSIVRSMLDPARTKVKGLYWRAPRLTLDQPISEVARLMVENDLRHLPVVEDGKVVGIVSSDDVLSKLANTSFGTTKVKELMTHELITLEGGDSIGKAIRMMREQGIARLPVLSGDKVAGIVTMHDIVHEVYEPRVRMSRGEGAGRSVKPLRDPVTSVMARPVVTVRPEDTVATAVKTMAEHDISSLVVVDERGNLQGMITKTDLLRPIAGAAVLGPSVKVQIAIRDPQGMEDLDRQRLQATTAAFVRKHERSLRNSLISIYLKRHRERRRGMKLTHCRILMNGPSGQYSAVGEGWGVHQAISEAMDNLERKVLRAKETAGSGRRSSRLLQETLGLLY